MSGITAHYCLVSVGKPTPNTKTKLHRLTRNSCNVLYNNTLCYISIA